MPAIEIVRATEADIPFIMATERAARQRRAWSGRWEREEHERALADASNAYFVGSSDGKPVGFVIVQHWASDNRATLIRRIIVADTGKRIGRELLSRVIDTIFAETDASRLWLNVFPHNTRAQTILQRARISLRGSRELSGSRGKQGAADGPAAIGLAWPVPEWSFRMIDFDKLLARNLRGRRGAGHVA